MLRTKYSNQFDVAFQQLRSRFAGHAEIISDVEGERYEWPIHGGTSMREYTGYNVDIVDSITKYDKRSMRYRKFYDSQVLSRDVLKDMQPLEMNFARIKSQMVAAARRMFDEVFLGVTKDATTGLYRLKTDADEGFLGGILGTNYVGAGGTDKELLDLAYGGDNLIPIDFASSGKGVSSNLAGTFVDRLLYLKAKLETMDAFDPVEKGTICVAISPAVKRELQSYEISMNRDYGFDSLGDAGDVALNPKLGVTFIVSNMLPTMTTKNKAGADVAGARMCCAWLKNRVGVGIWKDTQFEMLDVNTKVDVRQRLIGSGMMGASRKDKETTFVLPCLENIIV